MEKDFIQKLGKLLGERTSHREFKEEDISREILDDITDAARTAPSSRHGQAYSIVCITDKELKKQVSEIVGQPYIDAASAMLVFVTDFSRTSDLAQYDESSATDNQLNPLITSSLDIGLAMMAAIIKAESHNIGTCCIGALRFNMEGKPRSQQLQDLLNLPRHSIANCGLILGYKKEIHPAKGRIPKEAHVFYNKYDQEAFSRVKERFNNEMIDYYNSIGLPQFAQKWTESERAFYVYPKTSPNWYPASDRLLLEYAHKNGLLGSYTIK